MLVLELVIVMISVLISSGFFTLFERKFMGSIQLREGPAKVIISGFFQPISDALKLFSKTNLSTETSMELYFFLSPMITFFTSMLCWITLPTTWNMTSWYSSILFIMFCFSVSVYGLIFSGWFTRSKFASLGCIRALSQSVSYEIPLAMSLLSFMISFNTFSIFNLSLEQEMISFFFPFIFLMVLLLITLLAETNRSPFDLAEGESELVSGFSIELGSSSFVAVFLGEYLSILWISTLIVILFMGTINPSMSSKIVLMMTLFIWIRSSVPRMRFDHVMISCWIILLPQILSLLLLYMTTLFS